MLTTISYEPIRLAWFIIDKFKFMNQNASRTIGYSKSRTKQFIMLKQNMHRQPSEVTNYRPQLPPKWVDKLEETRDIIRNVG